MDYGWLAVGLMIVGLGILVLEVFVPSGGILAISTTITLTFSLLCAYAAWGQRAPAMWWGFCATLMLLVPTTLVSAFSVLPRTSFGRRALLVAPEAHELEPYREEAARLGQHVGQFGRTMTLMNPGGMVLVGGQRLHAFSEGMLIEPDTSVEIIEIRGTRVLVRPGEPPADSGTAAEQPAATSTLDFDVPAE